MHRGSSGCRPARHPPAHNESKNEHSDPEKKLSHSALAAQLSTASTHPRVTVAVLTMKVAFGIPRFPRSTSRGPLLVTEALLAEALADDDESLMAARGGWRAGG